MCRPRTTGFALRHGFMVVSIPLTLKDFTKLFIFSFCFSFPNWYLSKMVMGPVTFVPEQQGHAESTPGSEWGEGAGAANFKPFHELFMSLHLDTAPSCPWPWWSVSVLGVVANWRPCPAEQLRGRGAVKRKPYSHQSWTRTSVTCYRSFNRASFSFGHVLGLETRYSEHWLREKFL